MLYFQCINSSIFRQDQTLAIAYLNKDWAYSNLASRKKMAEADISQKPYLNATVEHYYAVTELLYDEILKPLVQVAASNDSLKIHKVYFVCTDNQIATPEIIGFVHAYLNKEEALRHLPKLRPHYIWENNLTKAPVQSAAGFYLVHERHYR